MIKSTDNEARQRKPYVFIHLNRKKKNLDIVKLLKRKKVQGDLLEYLLFSHKCNRYIQVARVNVERWCKGHTKSGKVFEQRL